MKRSIFAMGLVLLGAAVAGASETATREQTLLARVTVYWASGGGGSDEWTSKHIAASGARLRAGHCAVDPKRIPYGSKVMIAGTPCVAVDTGKHVISRKAARQAGRTSRERDALVVDRFFETKDEALAWAATHPHFMTVQVLSPNDRNESPSPAVTAVFTPLRSTLLAENSSSPVAFQAGSLTSHPVARAASYLP